MLRMFAVAIAMLTGIVTGHAASDNPFAETSQWSVSESWHSDPLTYTFNPDGTFKSSSGSGGKWIRQGASIEMRWPKEEATYRGTFSSNEIRGTGYWNKGSESFGTFTLRLNPGPEPAAPVMSPTATTPPTNVPAPTAPAPKAGAKKPAPPSPTAKKTPGSQR